MLTTDEVYMASIKDLYTRDECNKPTKMTIGDEYLMVLGTDSDAFQVARREVSKGVLTGDIKIEDTEFHLVASLIESWSFDEPCTNDNKVDLLKNSPSLSGQVDRIASKRADFVGKLLAGSKATRKKSST